MRNLSTFTARLAALLVFHAAGAGLASPTVLVTRPARVAQWLPTDNQTVYTLPAGEVQSLELNTSSISAPVYITVSPCTGGVRWAFYKGPIGNIDEQLSLVQKYSGWQMAALSIHVSKNERYLLQLSSAQDGAAAVSVRGEPTRYVRLRLRVRSRRRLAANWDPSPIDPQTTSYCIVASHRKNYTSLCAAQFDSNSNGIDCRKRIDGQTGTKRFENRTTEDNKVEDDDTYNIYNGDFNNIFRRKKFSRSTKVTDGDPLIVCVGERTHHLIENLDPSATYFVSVFGVARDRRAGSLLATGSVRPKVSTAKRLRENVPHVTDIRGKSVFYFKTIAGSPLWVSVSTCGGVVDVEVLIKGRRLFIARNIDRYLSFPVEAPPSAQETSDEGSVQFDSSSEETRIRYVIRVLPSRWDQGLVGVKLMASSSRLGINALELSDETAAVREIRQRRTCRSVDIAFLPATQNVIDAIIEYCVVAQETSNANRYSCASAKRSSKPCIIQHIQRPSSRVIVQKLNGLKAGKKYAIQVTATSKNTKNSVPYKTLFIETNQCKGE